MSSTTTGEWVMVPREAVQKVKAASMAAPRAADILIEQALELFAAAPPAPAAEPVGRLSIEHFRGSRAMENVDFEYTGQLEPGTYQVYTAPPPVEASQQQASGEMPDGLTESDLIGGDS